MKNIIAHRGFWFDVSEQNTKKSFERALSNGFGIETDLRDQKQSLVISHDMSNSGAMDFSTFLEICSQFDNQMVLALNVKADGLQNLLKQSDIKNPHFYFDMSVPDMLSYCHSSMPVFCRYSNIETKPSLYSESIGVWLDNFLDAKLNLEALTQFLKDEKKVVLVSPELHKRDESGYWCELKQFINTNPQWSELIGLCTDYPLKARDYFNGK
ncbi:hypothetical protein [Vibrio atlanticus]|uniref:hypothetical protein n=1 Tax=Vibrio atlanticus TaxID=693153 RepID=UPI003D0C9C2B